jgi:hypothetical protein
LVVQRPAAPGKQVHPWQGALFVVVSLLRGTDN